MEIRSLFSVILIGYLLGSLNFAIVFSKSFLKFDIRDFGSNNAGTTNVLRVMGKKWAICVLFFDILKAIVAVIIGGQILGLEGKLIAGICVILGHVFPLYFKFKGGKGVASCAGAMFAIDPKIFLGFVIIFFIVLFITKMVSLSSMIASLYVPIGMYINYENMIYVGVGVIISFGIIFLHRANIKRIIEGNENKIKFKKGE